MTRLRHRPTLIRHGRDDSGSSLAELLVVLPILGIFGLMTMSFFSTVLTRSTNEINRSASLSSSSLAAAQMSKLIRTALPPDATAANPNPTSFKTAQVDLMEFWAYTSGKGTTPQLVRIWVDATDGNQLKIATWNPTNATSPYTWPDISTTAPANTTSLGVRVASTNVFGYLAANTAGTNPTTLSTPVAVPASIDAVTMSFDTTATIRDGTWKTTTPSNYQTTIRIPNNL